MNSNNDEFLKQTRKQLDRSISELDAATLSRLNQARQKALQSYSGRRLFTFNFSVAAFAGAIASFSVVMLASWLWLSQPQPNQQIQLAYDDEDMNMLVSDAELELLEQLEFVSWLVIEQTKEADKNNAG